MTELFGVIRGYRTAEKIKEFGSHDGYHSFAAVVQML
jgi:hypothetical protein